MPIFAVLARSMWRLLELLHRMGPRIPLLLILFAYVAGFVAMQQWEPEGSPLQSPWQYTWYFMVTISTVGYGDISPSSTGGQAAALGIIWTCIAAFGVVVTQAAAAVAVITSKRRRGLMNLELSGHAVVLGYHHGRTEKIVAQIVAGGRRTVQDIVVAFAPETADECPMPDLTHCVRAPLDSPDLAERACLATAGVILIDSHRDDQALALALFVAEHNEAGHVVVALDDVETGGVRMRRIHRSEGFECVSKSDMGLAVRAMQDPGVSTLINIVTLNNESCELYRLDIPLPQGAAEPRTFTFGQLLLGMKLALDALPIAMTDSLRHNAPVLDNPGKEAIVQPGTSVFYLARERLTWQAVAQAVADMLPNVQAALGTAPQRS